MKAQMNTLQMYMNFAPSASERLGWKYIDAATRMMQMPVALRTWETVLSNTFLGFKLQTRI